MSTALLILCVLIWLPILLYQVHRRGFLILLVWLFIAPVASNIVNQPGRNPFFSQQNESIALPLEQRRQPEQVEYLTVSTRLKLTDWFEPNRILFGLLFVTFLLQAVSHKSLTRLNRVEKLMLAFSAVLVIGAFRSLRVLHSMRTVIDAFIIPFLAYYASRRLATSEARFRQIIQVVGGVGCYIILIALVERLQAAGFYYKLGGPFGHPSPLSFITATVFLIMLADALGNLTPPNEKFTFPRTVRWFVLCLAPLIILLVWSRGQWVGFLMSVGIFLLLGRRLTNPLRKVAFIGSTLIILSIAIVGLQMSSPQAIIQERVTERTNTIYARFGAWQLILQESNDVTSRLFGLGLNELRDVLGTTRTRFMGQQSETSSHNSYLSLLAELGVIGLLIYLAIMTSIMRLGLRLYRTGPHARSRWWGATVIGILAAYLVPALFANTLYLTDIDHIYAYVLMGGVTGLYSQHLLIPNEPPVFGNQRASPDTPLIVQS